MVSGIVGGLIGGIIGFFIGRYFSAIGGVCPILCDRRISTIYFALIGFLLAYGKF